MRRLLAILPLLLLLAAPAQAADKALQLLFAPNVVEGSSQTTVSWRTAIPTLTPKSIRIELSLEGGRPDSWTVIADGLDDLGAWQWRVPNISSRQVVLRISARDETGVIYSDVSTRFEILTAYPIATLTGPRVSANRRIEFEYAMTRPGSGPVASLELWGRRRDLDAQPWNMIVKTAEVHPPLGVDLADGRWELKLIAVDGQGNRGPPPGTGEGGDLELIVDTRKPRLKMESETFHGGYKAANTRHLVAWTAEDENLPERPISLEYSPDGGDTWLPVPGGLSIPNSGRYLWKLPPNEGDRYKLKISVVDVAGNTQEVMSRQAFVIDAQAPAISCYAQLDPSSRELEIEGNSITLEYEPPTNFRYAPVTRIALYFSRDKGKTWEIVEDEDRQPPFEFKATDGTYWLKMVAFDQAGNDSGIPDQATTPQLVVRFNLPKINAQFTAAPAPAETVQGGTRRTLKWQVTGRELPGASVSLSWTRDGSTWSGIVKDGPAIGSTEWRVPNEDIEEVSLRLQVRDRLGNLQDFDTGPFRIRYNLRDVFPFLTSPTKREDYASTKHVFLQYEPFSDSERSHIRSLTLWLSRDGGQTWERHADAPMDGRVAFEGSDATYGLWLAVTDDKGNSDGRPQPGAVPELALTIDTRAPEIQLLNLQAGESVMGGSLQEIRWQARDIGKELPADAIRIAMTRDNGATWLTVQGAEGLPNSGSFRWLTPLESPSPDGYRIRVEARDKAGNVGQAESRLPFQLEVTPALNLRGPVGKIRGGSAQAIQWEAQDLYLGNNPISLYYSRRGDLGPWLPIARGLPNTGYYLWKVPEESFPAGRVRIEASSKFNRSVSLTTAQDFSVDADAPRVDLVGPAYAKGSATLVWQSGGDGDLLKMRLWFSRNGGASWEPYGGEIDKLDAPIVFEAPDGSYGLYAAGIDALGNSEPEPVDGTQSELELVIFRGEPKVQLLSFQQGGVFRGGAMELLEWQAEGPYLSQNPVSIDFLVADKVLRTLATGLPAKGVQRLEIPPGIDSPDCRIRVTAVNQLGAEGKDESAVPFSIDSKAPVTRLSGAIGFGPKKVRPPEPTPFPPPAAQLQAGQPQGKDSAAGQGAAKPAGAAPAADAVPQGGMPVVGEPVAAAVPQAQLRPDELLLQEADKFREGERYIEAEGKYLATIDKTDQFEIKGRAQYGLGKIAADFRRKPEQAKHWFRLSLGSDPDRADVHNDLGVVLFGEREFVEAEERFHRGVQLAPGSGRYRCNWGMALYHLDRKPEALARFQEGMSREPDLPECAWWQAQIYTDWKDWENAIIYWQRAAKAFGAETPFGQQALDEERRVRHILQQEKAWK